MIHLYDTHLLLALLHHPLTSPSREVSSGVEHPAGLHDARTRLPDGEPRQAARPEVSCPRCCRAAFAATGSEVNPVAAGVRHAGDQRR
jgi:hypothetical protein